MSFLIMQPHGAFDIIRRGNLPSVNLIATIHPPSPPIDYEQLLQQKDQEIADLKQEVKDQQKTIKDYEKDITFHRAQIRRFQQNMIYTRMYANTIQQHATNLSANCSMMMGDMQCALNRCPVNQMLPYFQNQFEQYFTQNPIPAVRLSPKKAEKKRQTVIQYQANMTNYATHDPSMTRCQPPKQNPAPAPVQIEVPVKQSVENPA